MKQSKLCHICSNLRYEFEEDGYQLVDKYSQSGERVWWYRHKDNGNRICIVINLNQLYINVFKNSILIKVIS